MLNVVRPQSRASGLIRRISFVVENCDLLGYHTMSSGNSLLTFWDILSIPSSRVNNSRPLKMIPIGCAKTSVRNYHYSLCNSPEEYSSHPLRGGSLKSGNAIFLSFHLTTGAPRSCRGCLEQGEFWESLN